MLKQGTLAGEGNVDINTELAFSQSVFICDKHSIMSKTITMLVTSVLSYIFSLLNSKFVNTLFRSTHLLLFHLLLFSEWMLTNDSRKGTCEDYYAGVCCIEPYTFRYTCRKSKPNPLINSEANLSTHRTPAP